MNAKLENSHALVIGQGSIGRRHGALLDAMGMNVARVSRHDGHADYASVREGVEAHKPGYVIIANETSQHMQALSDIADSGLDPVTLVEKPLSHNAASIPGARPSRTFVGYQLRFHPCISALKKRLSGHKVLSAEIYVGQHLSQWRERGAYQESYSAKASRGGGVLRDLSHELDMVRWLFGDWRRLTALGGKRSTLETDSDDLYAVLMESASGAILTVQMNYLDQCPRRTMHVLTEQTTFSIDLIGALMAENGKKTAFESSMDEIYVAQHRAARACDESVLCSFDEGLATVETVLSIERAGRQGVWVGH